MGATADDWMRRALAAEEEVRKMKAAMAEMVENVAHLTQILEDSSKVMRDAVAEATPDLVRDGDIAGDTARKLALRVAARQFRAYEAHHRAKGPAGEEKAQVNADLAALCEQALRA